MAIRRALDWVMKSGNAKTQSECEKNGGRWNAVNQECVGGEVKRRVLDAFPLIKLSDMTSPFPALGAAKRLFGGGGVKKRG
jgi:hypothetical protein